MLEYTHVRGIHGRQIMEQCEDDYFILDDGPLGGAYKIVQLNKVLHKCVEWDDCILFIRKHMDKEQFWPNVWRSSGRDDEFFPVTMELGQ
jgi:hypothetical protein